MSRGRRYALATGLGLMMTMTAMPLVHAAVWAGPGRRSGSPVELRQKTLAVLGDKVLAMVTRGAGIVGLVDAQGVRVLWLEPDPLARPVPLRIAPDAVTWAGRWQWLSRVNLTGDRVIVVVMHRQVQGGFAEVLGYGRVVGRQGNIVWIRPVRLAANPACAALQPGVFPALITRATQWTSSKGWLPVDSLVQYTAYGTSDGRRLLGGVEDYGRAPCP
jgi:hypothetical protein